MGPEEAVSPLTLLIHSSLEGPGDRNAGEEGLRGNSAKERVGAPRER